MCHSCPFNAYAPHPQALTDDVHDDDDDDDDDDDADDDDSGDGDDDNDTAC